jgi:hypothetical protein
MIGLSTMEGGMSNSLKGMIAGFVASLVVAALLMLKSTLEIVPELNIIRLLTSLGSIGTVAAWMDHFIVGTLFWGLMFAAFDYSSNMAYWIKGLIFGVFAWLMMMVLFMPLAKAGLFGLKLGYGAPAVMLVIHLIYGAVLGLTYGLLSTRAVVRQPEASRPG